MSSLILHCLCAITFSSVSKSCFLSIRDLRRIRTTLNHSTAHTIATFLIHVKLAYCNSVFLNLPPSQFNRPQLILNASARAVSKSPKLCHINPLLKSWHRLNIIQHIEYKVLSITYKTFQSGQPSTAFSLFNSTMLLAPLTMLPCNVQFTHVSK